MREREKEMKEWNVNKKELRVRDDRRRMKWKRKRRREIIRDMERWNIKHVAIC